MSSVPRNEARLLIQSTFEMDSCINPESAHAQNSNDMIVLLSESFDSLSVLLYVAEGNQGCVLIQRFNSSNSDERSRQRSSFMVLA